MLRRQHVWAGSTVAFLSTIGLASALFGACSPNNNNGFDASADVVVCDPTSSDPAGCPCDPKVTPQIDCYSGPPGTSGKGICQTGTRKCTAQGTWTECVGQVTPPLDQAAQPCQLGLERGIRAAEAFLIAPVRGDTMLGDLVHLVGANLDLEGAPHRAAAVKWLAFLGSKKAQDTFNPVKGSIPARQDANAKLYGTYLKWALKEWKADKLAGSFVHGVVCPNAWKTKVDTALGLFLQTKDVKSLQSTLASAAKAG